MTGETNNPNSGTNTANANVTVIDSSHPYYLHPSDSPGMNLISTVFDGRGFLGWRRSILIALSAKKKLGFINGTCKTPDLNSPDFSQWSCCNDMVISWLLNTLSKDIGDSVNCPKILETVSSTPTLLKNFGRVLSKGLASQMVPNFFTFKRN